jgi:hypothetical protein
MPALLWAPGQGSVRDNVPTNPIPTLSTKVNHSPNVFHRFGSMNGAMIERDRRQLCHGDGLYGGPPAWEGWA